MFAKPVRLWFGALIELLLWEKFLTWSSAIFSGNFLPIQSSVQLFGKIPRKV